MVEDVQGGAAQHVAGPAVGADRPDERRGLRRRVDRAPHGRPGNAHTMGAFVVEGGEFVGGGPGGLDAPPARPGVALVSAESVSGWICMAIEQNVCRDRFRFDGYEPCRDSRTVEVM